MFRISAVLLLTLSTLQISVGAAVAQDSGDSDFVVCAAVMPCNGDGTVQAPFNVGPCADTYRSWCLADRLNGLEEDLNSCISKAEARHESVQKLRRKLRAARRQQQD